MQTQCKQASSWEIGNQCFSKEINYMLPGKMLDHCVFYCTGPCSPKWNSTENRRMVHSCSVVLGKWVTMILALLDLWFYSYIIRKTWSYRLWYHVGDTFCLQCILWYIYITPAVLALTSVSTSPSISMMNSDYCRAHQKPMQVCTMADQKCSCMHFLVVCWWTDPCCHMMFPAITLARHRGVQRCIDSRW